MYRVGPPQGNTSLIVEDVFVAPRCCAGAWIHPVERSTHDTVMRREMGHDGEGSMPPLSRGRERGSKGDGGNEGSKVGLPRPFNPTKGHELGFADPSTPFNPLRSPP